MENFKLGQKIKLSSNIPITLPERLSSNKFGVGFLYPCGKGLELKEGETWFEKVCLSLNKMNAFVGFKNSDSQIPEYIVDTISMIEKQLGQTSLLIRYNAQTRINDLMYSVAPEISKVSFNDKIAKSLTKGMPMVILGERSLKNMFPQFEQTFGLKQKINFIVNHEIAHNIDASRGYSRGEYSLKDIMERHLGSNVHSTQESPFKSNAELAQAKTMIKQFWTLSLEHYADVLGFLNMRNQLLETNRTTKEISDLLDTLIIERHKSFEKNVVDLANKNNSELKEFITFEDRYKCINHFTSNALIELKDKLNDLSNKILTIKEIEDLTVNIVNKADLKSLYIFSKLDNKTSELLDKILESTPNKNGILEYSESQKQHFESKVKELLGDNWVKEFNKYLVDKNQFELYINISETFGSKTEDLQSKNHNSMSGKIQQIRYSLVTSLSDKITKKI